MPITYEIIEQYHGTETYAFGINNRGEIVGYSSGGSYVYYQGVYTTYDGWGFRAINDFGTRVGDQVYPNNEILINPPPGTYTDILAINNVGGMITYISGSPSVSASYYLFEKGTYTLIDYPGNGDVVDIATGINDLGVVVGWFYGTTGYQSFSYNDGAYSLIDVEGYNREIAVDINNRGDILATAARDSDGVWEYFLYNYNSGLVQKIGLNPTPQYENLISLNDNGDIVGTSSQVGRHIVLIHTQAASGIEVSIGEATGFEGSKLAFKVELSSVAATDMAIGFATHGGTAADGLDFAGMTGVLNIPAGERSGYIYIDAASDGIPEGDESFTVSITAPAGVTVADGVATGTIKDPKTAAELFNGHYLQTMAEFAFAAYHLGDWEPSDKSTPPRPDLNKVTSGAEGIYEQLMEEGWHLLSATELAMPLGFQTLQTLASGFVEGLQGGIFTFENGAALVARSSDALVISFRGTNDRVDSSFDHADWLNFQNHYAHFAELISAIQTYVDQNSIGQVYVTGHSMGAAMAEAFLGTHRDTPVVKYEGVTFASPGFWEEEDLVNYNHSRLVQLYNTADPIELALPLGGHELTGNTNKLYFAEVKAAPYALSAHSMSLYLALQKEMFASGVPDAAFVGTGGWLDYDIFVTKYTVINSEHNLYSVAKGNDVLYGGVVSSFSYDLLFGGAGNDVLDGRDGRDALFGGADNDTYVLGNETSGTDRVEDTAGIDTITTAINRSLAFADFSEIENLTLLTGATTGVGNALRNTITGDAANNTLNGLTNVDRLVGGNGNDTYYVDATIDTVVEAAGAMAGTADRVIFTGNAGQTYVLAANVELLTLAGSAGSRGTGNALANTITGNSAANILNGAGNTDTLNGGLGNDTLTGGAGDDFFLFNTALNNTNNRDQIVDFSVLADTIKLENAIFTQLTATGLLAASKFAAGNVVASADSHTIYYSMPTGGLFYDTNGAARGGDAQFATLAPNLALTRADFFVV